MFKNILFRADSSSTIGTGHIMRDLVLAKQYPKANTTFATQQLDGNINHKIIEAGYKIEIVKSNDIDEVIKLIKKYKIDMVVIDHYGIDYKYEKKLKEKTNVKILSFDDTYEKHCCDILLNQSIGANKKKYKRLVPKNCELRCGAKYALIRDEFVKEKKKKRTHKKNKTVFIAMGGADSFDMNIKILKMLKNTKINLVTTSANKNLDKLIKYAKKNKNIHLFINSNNIAKIMHKSDFAIATPSVIISEIIFMGLPFIAICVTNNQKSIYEYLKSKKFYVLKSSNLKKLPAYVGKLKTPKGFQKNIVLLNKITRGA